MRLFTPIGMFLTTMAWIVAVCAPTIASIASMPSEAVLEDVLLADVADARLDRFSLFEATLIASGARDRETLDRYGRRLEAICRDYEPRRPSDRSPSAEARALLRFLHQRVFTEYDAACSDVRRTLDDGAYNCVSATVLYQVLGRRFGLSVAPVAAPAHVRCRLLGGKPLDVETTCADWFKVVDRYPDPADQAALVSRASGQPTEPRRVLTDVELLGKIYYNRGVALLQQQAYRRAMTASRIGWELDRNDSAARENLLSAMNNAALQSADAGQFEQAVALLLECYRLAPDYAPLAANDLYVHQRWIAHLCELERFGEALDVLDRARRRRPEAALFNQGHHAVYQAWIDCLVSKAAGRK